MKLAWLQRLLADRGIDASHVVSLSITTTLGNPEDTDLFLDVVTELPMRAVWDASTRGYILASEHHLVPLGGMVFEPA